MRWVRRIAWAFLALAWTVALVPGFFAPYSPVRQHRDYPYSPPGRYGEARVQYFVSGDAYTVLGILPVSRRLFGAGETGYVFLAGTDEFGRDLYSRLCYGLSTSLLVAPAAVALSLVLGLILGALAGYAGGTADALIMRLGQVFLALPWFYFIVALRAALPLQLSSTWSVLLVFLLLGTLGWAVPARLFRGQVLALRKQEYITAARSIGAGRARIFLRHLLPGLLPAARTQFLLSLPAYIITEVSLSFLGLGVAEPAPTLGNLLTPLQQYLVLTSYVWMFTPAAVIVAVAMALHIVAEQRGP